MNLLYVADNGFSINKGKYYCTAPNKTNIDQYYKYFDTIHIVARESTYQSNTFEIGSSSEVVLIKKNDFFALYRAMCNLRDKYDAILMRNGINGCFAGMFGRWLGKTTIAYCGADPYDFQRANRGFLRRNVVAPIWGMLERRKMAKADFSQYCTQYLFNKYPTKHPYLICSNVDIVIDNRDLDDRIRKIATPSKMKVIGMIGRLDENKGIRTVIRALASLGGDYRFEFIGGGNPEPFIEEINSLGIRDRIDFLGYCSDKQKMKNWLKTIDIYIQPSLSEGLPRSTIEAMAIACPCIATNIAGLPDLLEKQYLIQPRDNVALEEKIKWLARNGEAAKEAAIKSFEKAKDFQRDVRDQKLDSFFSEIVNTVSIRSE